FFFFFKEEADYGVSCFSGGLGVFKKKKFWGPVNPQHPLFKIFFVFCSLWAPFKSGKRGLAAVQGTHLKK
ncbi:hypothetical protein Q2446_27625, partial [Escherichia coli]|nr:hypothetical protein [Escherichia coli]